MERQQLPPPPYFSYAATAAKAAAPEVAMCGAGAAFIHTLCSSIASRIIILYRDERCDIIILSF